MPDSETDLFWESVNKWLEEACHEIPPESYLWPEHSSALVPILSTDSLAVEVYDQRLADTLSSWDRDNWETSSTLEQRCTSSQPISEESLTSVIEFCALKGKPMSNSHESRTHDEVSEAHNKSDVDEHPRGVADDEDVIEDEDSIETEDDTNDEEGTNDDDFIDDKNTFGDEDAVEDEDRAIAEDVGVMEDEDVFSESNGTDLLNEKEANNSTDNISSNTATYSCRGCSKPDNEWMIACDNSEAHGDKEAWYHYQCVQISQDSVPEGQWYCPPCRVAMEASDHAGNQDPLKRRAATKPTQSKGSTLLKSKATKASGNRVTKASQVRGKPADKDAEVPRSSKPKKDVGDTQVQDSEEEDPEEDDFEGNESVKILRKTQKAKKPSAPKEPWRHPIEEQRVIELMKDIQSDPTVDKKISFSEDKWILIRDLLKQRYGFIRTSGGIKNRWTRKLRAQSGYDERGENHKNPTKLTTSVESPEDRKRRRQAKAQAKAQSSTVQRKARAEKQNEAHEERTCDETILPEGEGEKVDGPLHGPLLDERLQYFREDEYDFSQHKNKGKRKRDDAEDEYDFSPDKNKGKRQRDN